MNDAIGIFYRFTQIITQFAFYHLDHDIPGIIVTLTHYLLTILHLIYLLYRKKHLLYDFTPSTTGNFLIQIFLYLTLLAADHTQYIPLRFRSWFAFHCSR